MKYLIALDDGHGMETPGKRTPNFDDGTFMHENKFNREVVNYLDKALKRCGFDTLLVAPGDSDTPLGERVRTANNAKANAYISVHANAMTGKWGVAGGIETYIYPKAGKATKRLAELVHGYLLSGTEMRDRGLKTADFYVLRETNMPAVLVECGFMDNKREAILLKSDEYRRECAEEICKGVCKYYQVEYVAEALDTTGLTPIAGVSVATPEQIKSYMLRKNPTPKINCPVDDFIGLYNSLCKAENIRMDVAVAQMWLETGGLKYGGIVTADMNNFAGLGALDGNGEGEAASFGAPMEGIQAQVQHLKAYANTDPVNLFLVDPRFEKVIRGSAPFVEWLGQKENPNGKGWASDEGYGAKVLTILDEILAEKVSEDEYGTKTKIIIDGKEIYAETINKDNFNYVKVRDLLVPLGYAVDWDAETEAIVAVK